MKKTTKKVIALVLALSLILTPVLGSSAFEKGSDYESKFKFAHTIDKVFDKVLDTALNGAMRLLFSADSFGFILKNTQFPTVDDFLAQDNEYFYEGTDGALTGSGWKLGYQQASVIPLSWRENASGKQDDNGMCLNKTYWFGGYFTSTVDKIYDDETLSLAVLSAGTDKNRNGIDDIFVIAALDNIGMSNGNVLKIRKAISEKLVSAGIAADDILAIEFNCTHAHSVIEALGMSLDSVFTTALKNHFFLKKDTSVKEELFNNICDKAAECAYNAYKGMKNGKLYYYESENLDDYMKENVEGAEADKTYEVARDKLGYGADCQKFFACWYFKADDGEKTVLANIGMHPTFAGRDSKRVCADYPYYFKAAMKSMGYNAIFIQGSQAAIGTGCQITPEGNAWAEENTLTKEDWANRYGQKYADKKYSEEQDYFRIKAFGYSIAQAVVDAVSEENPLEPSVNIKMDHALIPFDYSVMYVAGNSGVFGYNTVRMDGTETGYGLVTEIGYMELGNQVVMLMLPGEVSPAITFGKADSYTGTDTWTGEGSWSGEEWKYDTIENMAKEALGSDKKIIAMGIANDEVGYVMPDTDTADNFLTKTILKDYGYQFGRADNEELMMASKNAGSALAQAYEDFFAK